jgi:hypothetical protein
MTDTNTIETTATVSEAPAAANGAVLFVPLGKLKKSPRNARKTPHSEAHIEALAASIAAKGMLQNLVVEPETDAEGEPTGCYFVTIGEGRRLAQLLRVKRKQIRKSEAMLLRSSADQQAREWRGDAMPRSDWRSPAAYAHATSIPAAGFAWEYLRRDDDYRRALRRARTLPRADSDARNAFSERWGLRFPGRSRSACRTCIAVLAARAVA